MEGSSSWENACPSISGSGYVTRVADPELRAIGWTRALSPYHADSMTLADPRSDDAEFRQVSALASRPADLHVEITGVILQGLQANGTSYRASRLDLRALRLSVKHGKL
jgi:hypothetical protein